MQKSGLFFSILLLIKMPFVLFYEDIFVYREPEFTEQEMRRYQLEFIEPQLRYRQAEIAKKEFDTVFIGSSRTSYSIVPAYFDALGQKQTKSYNFGINGGFPPQTFDWCEELIQTKTSLKYIFFELSERNMNYAMANESWEDFSFSKFVAQSENYLNLLAVSAVKPRNLAEDNRNNIKKRGHLYREYQDDYNIPLERVFEKEDEPANENVSLHELELINLRNLRAEKENFTKANLVNDAYWKRISKLIELAELKQIHLYFYIPARLASDDELKTIYPIYEKLERKYKLSVSHYDQSLYQIDTSYDDFHLNHKGARIFTELIAEAFTNHNF